eukprot:scaffold149_cov315-Pinguiococcus_pyrenoidosus.AAC.7
MPLEGGNDRAENRGLQPTVVVHHPVEEAREQICKHHAVRKGRQDHRSVHGIVNRPEDLREEDGAREPHSAQERMLPPRGLQGVALNGELGRRPFLALGRQHIHLLSLLGDQSRSQGCKCRRRRSSFQLPQRCRCPQSAGGSHSKASSAACKTAEAEDAKCSGRHLLNLGQARTIGAKTQNRSAAAPTQPRPTRVAPPFSQLPSEGRVRETGKLRRSESRVAIASGAGDVVSLRTARLCPPAGSLQTRTSINIQNGA